MTQWKFHARRYAIGCWRSDVGLFNAIYSDQLIHVNMAAFKTVHSCSYSIRFKQQLAISYVYRLVDLNTSNAKLY